MRVPGQPGLHRETLSQKKKKKKKKKKKERKKRKEKKRKEKKNTMFYQIRKAKRMHFYAYFLTKLNKDEIT